MGPHTACGVHVPVLPWLDAIFTFFLKVKTSSDFFQLVKMGTDVGLS